MPLCLPWLHYLPASYGGVQQKRDPRSIALLFILLYSVAPFNLDFTHWQDRFGYMFATLKTIIQALLTEHLCFFFFFAVRTVIKRV
uniref:Uncharacterized protein n=1 Tax=Rhipicephalus zambeziensis TaxID=60191 RepID=A0A224Y7L4_9ACAR